MPFLCYPGVCKPCGRVDCYVNRISGRRYPEVFALVSRFLIASAMFVSQRKQTQFATFILIMFMQTVSQQSSINTASAEEVQCNCLGMFYLESGKRTEHQNQGKAVQSKAAIAQPGWLDGASVCRPEYGMEME